MRAPRRNPTHLLALAVLAVVAMASCGVEPGATAPTGPRGSTATTAAPDDGGERTPEDEAAVATVADYYEGLGLGRADAECLADAVADLQAGGEVPTDPSEMMGLFTACGLTLEDLTALNERLTEGGDDPLTAALEQAMASFGLDEEQSSCVAARYVEEYGPTDLTAMQDPQVLLGFLGDCGIDPTDLQPSSSSGD